MCSHLLATVHTLVDRALPQPLEGVMSATLWRLKRSHDASYHSPTAHMSSTKRRVIIAAILFIRPPGMVVPGGLMFYCRGFFFVSTPDLRARSADRRETLPTDQKVLPFYNLGPKIWCNYRSHTDYSVCIFIRLNTGSNSNIRIYMETEIVWMLVVCRDAGTV